MPLSTLAESGASMSYGHIFPCSFTNEEIKIKFDVDDFIFDFIEDFSLLYILAITDLICALCIKTLCKNFK
jgi:hypothetical protein